MRTINPVRKLRQQFPTSAPREARKGQTELSLFEFFRPESPSPNCLSHCYTFHNLKLLGC
jgi:hypothetical protein